MTISPSMVYLLDILSECEIGPFSGSIRNVVGEEMGRSGGRKEALGLPRGGEREPDRQNRHKIRRDEEIRRDEDIRRDKIRRDEEG